MKNGTSTAKRVLIVEDDSELINIIETVLRSIDPEIEIDCANRVESAVEQLKKARKTSPRRGYDLVIADIFLEGEATGIDLWTRCTDLCPEMPVVIMSALPLNKFLATLGQGSITPPYLAKPLELHDCKQLFEGMFDYADRNRQFSRSDMRKSA